MHSITSHLIRLGGIGPRCCCSLQYAAKMNYATQPKLKSKSGGTVSDIESLLRRVPDLPDEEITVFVKYAGQTFNYNKSMRRRSPRADQALRIEKPQIKSTVGNATSVEDYLYMPPSPTQPFPGFSKLPNIYAGLSKSRLTMLVVLTTMGGYALAPGTFDLSTLLLLSAGTALQSAAANTTNQVMEVKYDTQMFRTRNRVLVRGLISREHAAGFAFASGVMGTSLLYFGVNPLTCCLGAFNYILYTMVYTPMKRRSISNTWFGSLVGALPPMMGWTAATASVDMGALWLGAVLYIWQFPHFKALSWNIKNDYQRAGYQMSAVTDPAMCKRVAFRHTVFMTLACCLGPVVGTTTNMFILYSLPCNMYGVYLGWRFYRDGDSKSSRNLFRFSLVQIPYLIVMMLVSKKWERAETEAVETKVVRDAT